MNKLELLGGHLAMLLDRPPSRVPEVIRNMRDHASAIAEMVGSRGGSDGELGDAELMRVGRGPGGGLTITPTRSTLLLLALALDPPRRDLGDTLFRAWHLIALMDQRTEMGVGCVGMPAPCSLTGTSFLGRAIQALISDVTLAARVTEVRIALNGRAGEIRFDESLASRFSDNLPANISAPYCRREVILSRQFFVTVAQMLARGAR